MDVILRIAANSLHSHKSNRIFLHNFYLFVHNIYIFVNVEQECNKVANLHYNENIRNDWTKKAEFIDVVWSFLIELVIMAQFLDYESLQCFQLKSSICSVLFVIFPCLSINAKLFMVLDNASRMPKIYNLMFSLHH